MDNKTGSSAAGAPLIRSKLESLSTDELISLADTYGIDIPAGLERIFIIEELLFYSSADKPKNSEEMEVSPSYHESVLLPKQYNISYIEAIVRDPLWIYVFWEVKGHDREIYENAADFNGYCLRLIPLDSEGKEPKSKENTFTVAVNIEDNARYLGIAPAAKEIEASGSGSEAFLHDSNCYVIKLGVIRGSAELHIASSLPFYMPLLSENEAINSLSRNDLIRLSGIQDLSITRNTDRQFRIKRQN